MVEQNRKELADDLAYLEILLEKILEMVERGTLPLKAADALKIIELRQKLKKDASSSRQDVGRLFMDMIRRGERPETKKNENNPSERTVVSHHRRRNRFPRPGRRPERRYAPPGRNQKSGNGPECHLHSQQ